MLYVYLSLSLSFAAAETRKKERARERERERKGEPRERKKKRKEISSASKWGKFFFFSSCLRALWLAFHASKHMKSRKMASSLLS